MNAGLLVCVCVCWGEGGLAGIEGYAPIVVACCEIYGLYAFAGWCFLFGWLAVLGPGPS
jgi:hypothetical protein